WDGLLVLVDNDNDIFDIKYGDEIEVHVSHGVNEPDYGVGEESLNEAFPNNHPPSSTIVLSLSTFPSNPTTETLFDPHPSSNVPPSSDPIIDHDSSDDEVEDESRSEGDTNEDTEVDSDVHQEYINIRENKMHFKRSQRRSRGTTSYQIHVGEKRSRYMVLPLIEHRKCARQVLVNWCKS
ncbi:hypothetical protein H5410_015717, partial [Solanum commersonii]